MKQFKHFLTPFAVAALMAASAAHAAPVASAASAAEGGVPAHGGQQNRMATCAKEAMGKKGDERRAFMKECLSTGKKAANDPEAVKLKACKAEAKGLRGNERKDAIAQCVARADA